MDRSDAMGEDVEVVELQEDSKFVVLVLSERDLIYLILGSSNAQPLLLDDRRIGQ